MQFAQRGVWGGWKPHKYWVFPHYMWGYIAIPTLQSTVNFVPSLYVRVYRSIPCKAQRPPSSLIICEGISSWKISRTNLEQFPHYMWGYIGCFGRSLPLSIVPSLYVRVYRVKMNGFAALDCSLIICEGISPWWLVTTRIKRFPHYMWGYIELNSITA